MINFLIVVGILMLPSLYGLYWIGREASGIDWARKKKSEIEEENTEFDSHYEHFLGHHE